LLPFLIEVIKATEYNRTQCSFQHLEDKIYSKPFNDNDNGLNNLMCHSFEKSEVTKEENLSFKDPVDANLHQNSSLRNCNSDITDRFEAIETPEIINQLNNTELVELNSKDIDDYFEKSQALKTNNLENSNGFLDKLDIDFIKRHQNISKKYMIKLKYGIIRFIKQSLAEISLKFYSKRLDTMDKLFDVLKRTGIRNRENIRLQFSGDHLVIEALNRLHKNFKNNKIFDRKTYNFFSRAFDVELSQKINLSSCKDKLIPLRDFKLLNFYYELMKLLRYTDEIPELLALGGLYTSKLYHDLSFVLHVFNLFIENIGNLKENKTFILCMIYKAYSISNKKTLDFFLLRQYHLICHKEHFNGFFFLWEIHTVKRNDMKKRLNRWKSLKCNNLDNYHLKTILLIYLYQHINFLIYYDFSNEVIETFIAFVESALNSYECFACHFDKFLIILKDQLKSLK
jgi:hypothetical protein